MIKRDLQYYKFCTYGFLKNLKFFDPFMLLFFREMGMSFLQIGVLFSVREISTLLLEIPTGILADLFGRKNAMILSFIAYCISFMVFYTFSIYSLYIFAMVLYGIGEAFRTGTHKAMILDYLQINEMYKHKTEYYGSTRSWSQRGSALSALIAGTLVFYNGGYRIVFLASTFPYVLDLFLMLSYPKALNGLDSGFKKSARKIRVKDFLSIFRKSEFRRGILNSSIYDGLFKTVKDYLQPILKGYALSLPILLFIEDFQRGAIVIAVVYFILYNLTSYSSKKSWLFSNAFKSLPKAINFSFLAGVILTLLSGLFYRWEIHIISVILFIALYVFQNIRRPMNVSYIGETIPSQTMATGLSVESQIKAITIAILSPLLGLLADNFGIGSSIAILSAVFILILPFVYLKR